MWRLERIVDTITQAISAHILRLDLLLYFKEYKDAFATNLALF